MKIYIKYSTWDNMNKVLAWSNEQELNTLEFKPIPNATRINSVTLRGGRISHLLHGFYVWNVVISADELVSTTKYNFIVSLFQSGNGKYSTNDDAQERWETGDTTVTEFTVEADKLPVEFLENSKYLPEVKLEFIQKYRT